MKRLRLSFVVVTLLLIAVATSRAEPEAAGSPAIAVSGAVVKLDQMTSRFAAYLQSLHSYEVVVKTDWKVRGKRSVDGGGTTRLIVDGDRFHLNVGSANDPTTFIAVGDGRTVSRILDAGGRVVYSQAPGTFREMVADQFTASTLQGTGLDLLDDPDLPGTVMASVSNVRDLGDDIVDGVPARHFSANWDNRGAIEIWLRLGNSPALLKTQKTVEMGIGDRRESVTTTNVFAWQEDRDLSKTEFEWQPPQKASKVPDIYAHLLEGSSKQLLGKPVPPVTLKQLDGSPWESNKLGDGKATIIYFWTTWAAAPIESLRDVDKFVGEYSSKGVSIYAVNVGEEEAVVRAYVSGGKYPGRVVLDAEGEAARALGITSVPTALLVDRRGIIQAVYIGQSLEVRKLVKEHIQAVLRGENLVGPEGSQE